MYMRVKYKSRALNFILKKLGLNPINNTFLEKISFQILHKHFRVEGGGSEAMPIFLLSGLGVTNLVRNAYIILEHSL